MMLSHFLVHVKNLTQLDYNDYIYYITCAYIGGRGISPIHIQMTILSCAYIWKKTEDQNGEETMFKIKKSTKMKKVFAAYAARKGVEANASKFFAICYYVILYLFVNECTICCMCCMCHVIFYVCAVFSRYCALTLILYVCDAFGKWG